MRSWSRPSRPALAVLGLAFAASVVLYSGLWISTNRAEYPKVELGFNDDYEPSQHDYLTAAVSPNSPAEKAGLRRGDRIIAIDGARVLYESFQRRLWLQHQPGDQVQLTVRRPGAPVPLILTGTFRANPSSSPSDFISQQVSLWYPVPFAVIGLAVLFLRLGDPNAWLLACIFAGLITSRGLPVYAPRPPWMPYALAYQALMISLLGPVLYWFFAVFPSRSPLDRRMPRLKWICLAIAPLLAWTGPSTGGIRLPPPLHEWLGQGLSSQIAALFALACIGLGLFSFAANYFGSPDQGARRKMRVMFWGTAASLGPTLVDLLVRTFTGRHDPPWLDTIHLLLLFLFPLSLAYAVVVHQVLEIPVLLRRSARYLLVQRGFTFLLSLISIGITLVFALSVSRYFQPGMEIAQSSSIAIGAVFGTALLWSGTQVHKRVSGRIDRAFFRSAYDARVILEDLAEKTRTATGRPELANLLEQHLTEALHPSFLTIHLQSGDPHTLHQPECVVPILGRDGRRLGAIILGPRLSEEPYSGEDQRLLASVASQTAAALENIRLAEEIAERIEAERRSALEMEIAREVQSRLLPQTPPRLQTLDCAACCIQARAVGGDYYDFLDLGPGRVGLVLADVSGKGVHAALLVANLEAYMRSQSSMRPFNPLHMLEQVNRMLYASTAVQHYATVFFGAYDDSTRLLSYVNCGHNPAIWLRADGCLRRLEATGTVIGAFPEWQAKVGHAQLDPSDLLVVFSDGVTEANRGEEEFGEDRLIEELRSVSGCPAAEIVPTILDSVQRFSAGAQYDDLTLLVGRALPA